jgi:hypothetical protein
MTEVFIRLDALVAQWLDTTTHANVGHFLFCMEWTGVVDNIMLLFFFTGLLWALAF